MERLTVKLPIRVALLTLILVNTPSAARPAESCPGAVGQGSVSWVGAAAAPCLPVADASPVTAERAPIKQCVAANFAANDRLLELHRSVRDGGLAGLWSPARGASTRSILAQQPGLTGCGVG